MLESIQMSSSAPSSPLRNLLGEIEALFHTETEACAAARVQAAERALGEHLNQSVRRLRQASGFGDMAAVLCDAGARFCNCCAVFRVNQGVVTGESLRCGAGEASPQFGEIQFPVKEAAAFAEVVELREPVVAICSAAEVSRVLISLFGHVADDRAHLFPLLVAENTVGVLYASGAVESPGLELLAQTAGTILEAQQPAARPAAPDLVRIELPPVAPSQKPEPAWNFLPPADRSIHVKAQRFARVQIAEMRLYQSEAVRAGRVQGDLYGALQNAIDAGREAFRQNFIASTPSMVDYFHEELVRTLANNETARLGDKYPGPLV